MAEIKIEKKKPIWPWLLLGLLLLGLVWYFFMREPVNKMAIDDDRMDTLNVQHDVNAERNAAIAVYSGYISDTDKMGVDHEYTHGALTRLIDAVEAKADMHDVDLNADLDEARRNASEITVDANKLNHADLIKNSGKIITRALTTLQVAKFPTLSQDVANVDAAVSAIDTSDKTLDQKDVVNNFFNSAESLLLKMQ